MAAPGRPRGVALAGGARRVAGGTRRRPRSGRRSSSSGSGSPPRPTTSPARLSGGQRKLLEMARALMVDPEVVMLDEPMAGINPALTQSLLAHITGLQADGKTVVFVEHDMDVSRRSPTGWWCMAEGKVIAEGLARPDRPEPEGDRRLPRCPPRGGGVVTEPAARRRGAGRRIHPRGGHPPGHGPGADVRGDRRDHRPQRSREVDVRQGRLRAGPGAERVGEARRRRHHREEGARAGGGSVSVTCPSATTCSPR